MPQSSALALRRYTDFNRSLRTTIVAISSQWTHRDRHYLLQAFMFARRRWPVEELLHYDSKIDLSLHSTATSYAVKSLSIHYSCSETSNAGPECWYLASFCMSPWGQHYAASDPWHADSYLQKKITVNTVLKLKFSEERHWWTYLLRKFEIQRWEAGRVGISLYTSRRTVRGVCVCVRGGLTPHFYGSIIDMVIQARKWWGVREGFQPCWCHLFHSVGH